MKIWRNIAKVLCSIPVSTGIQTERHVFEYNGTPTSSARGNGNGSIRSPPNTMVFNCSIVYIMWRLDVVFWSSFLVQPLRPWLLNKDVLSRVGLDAALHSNLFGRVFEAEDEFEHLVVDVERHLC